MFIPIRHFCEIAIKGKQQISDPRERFTMTLAINKLLKAGPRAPFLVKLCESRVDLCRPSRYGNTLLAGGFLHLSDQKRKGCGMGGVPPLGYRVQDRKLVISTARQTRALDLSPLCRTRLGAVVKAELEARGIKSESWTSAAGRLIGGNTWVRDQRAKYSFAR